MRELAGRLASLAASAAVTATRPTAADDGADCTGWYRKSGLAPTRALLELDGSEAATIADPTGGAAGVEVWGNFGSADEWRLLAILNAGDDIPIVAAKQGWAVVLELGVAPNRIQVAGTPSAGTVTATYTPLEVHG